MASNVSSLDTESDTAEIYHERQSMMLCAVHAVNNLLQKKNAVTKQQFDDICNNLSPDSWINPHRNLLGLGNYDVNVIMTALQVHGYQTVWFDKRRSVNTLNPENIFGYLMNIPSRMPLVSMFQGKHWFAVRCIGGSYYNLDSKLSKPQVIGHTVLQFLGTVLRTEQTQLLLIVTEDVAEKKLWQHNDSLTQSVESSSST